MLKINSRETLQHFQDCTPQEMVKLLNGALFETFRSGTEAPDVDVPTKPDTQPAPSPVEPAPVRVPPPAPITPDEDIPLPLKPNQPDPFGVPLPERRSLPEELPERPLRPFCTPWNNRKGFL